MQPESQIVVELCFTLGLEGAQGSHSGMLVGGRYGQITGSFNLRLILCKSQLSHIPQKSMKFKFCPNLHIRVSSHVSEVQFSESV